MNIPLLKYLVSLADNQVNAINTNALFEKYPRDAYSSDLYSLEQMGFITLLNGNNRIINVGVNQKAIDYVQNYNYCKQDSSIGYH